MPVTGGRPLNPRDDIWVLWGTGSPVGQQTANRGAGSLYLQRDGGSSVLWQKTASGNAGAWSSGGAGAVGPAGPQGERGPVGATGPAGDDGSDGAPGSPGADGPQGIQGIQGIPGVQGPTGNTGPAGTTDYLALSNRPTLGTAAAQNVGAFATAAQGTDARTPLAHTQAASTISDSTAAGRAVLTAADASAQRTALGVADFVPTVSATSATTGTMTVAMGQGVRTITPTGACTFNASGGVAGQTCTFAITTQGSSSFTLTWGTNFRKAGTLATGNTAARFFSVTFVCVVTNGVWQEIARTAVQT